MLRPIAPEIAHARTWLTPPPPSRAPTSHANAGLMTPFIILGIAIGSGYVDIQ